MKRLLLLLLVASAASVAHAQNPPDACRVSGSVWSKSEKLGTGPYIYGEFQPVAFDKWTDKSFKNEESNLTVNAHVEYGDFNAAEKLKPTYIKLTLEVFNQTQKPVASADDAATAQTTYGKHWGSLTVERSVTIGNHIYTFGLTCEDGTIVRKRSRLQRRTPNKSLDASRGSVFRMKLL